MTDDTKSAAYILAEELLSRVFYGKHHISGKIYDRGRYAECNVDDLLSTYDSNFLTRLVIAAHDMCCRIEIKGSGPGRFKLWLSPRKPIEERGEFPIMKGHETIENAIKVFRSRERKQYVERGNADDLT